MKLKPLLISLAAVSALAAGAANAAQVIVTTGAGYVKMVDALAALYQKETGVAVEKSFGGNIGQMLAQVKHGSGVNVVISDEASLEKFHDALAPDARRLGDTPLVLVWRKGLELKRPEDIALDSVKTVASPNPKAAVYGRSAAKWLKATGLDAKVAPKLQVVGTVPQVYSYVTTGNMDAGFVNLAVLKSGTEALGGHAAIRDESAVVHMTVRPVRGAEADADVKAFMDFLASEKAKPVLRKFGIECGRPRRTPAMIDLILNEPQLLFSLALTAKTCLVTLALFLVAGPLAGYYLARAPGVAPRVLGFIITIPLVFPPVALGYMLLTALGRTSLVGGALEPFGLSLIFNETAVALAGFIAGLPLVVRPLQAAFASPRLIELEEAARIHGAGRRDVFLRITLPLVRPSLAAALLLGCARVSGEVGITMMLGGNISERTNTLSLEIFNAVSRADFDAANALCLLLSLFAAVIFLAAELLIRRSPRL